MNLRIKACVVVALWAVLVAGCKEAGRDCPAAAPQQDTPKAAEPATPPKDDVPATAKPETALPEKTPDKKVPDEKAPAKPAPAKDEVDLDKALKEIAELERDAKYSGARMRARQLWKIYQGREEAKELSALYRRLQRDYSTASGLDFAVRKLGSGSDVEISHATEKLLDAGEVGLVFLRKAVRVAEPKTAICAAGILMDQGEPQTTQLIVERMEQDPPEPLGDELGKVLGRLDEIESEWIDRLCALAKREGPSQAAAVDVLIDRLERAVRTRKATKPENTRPEAAKKDESKPPEPAPIELDERLVRTLYEVAETATGSIQRRSIDALVLVLDEANGRDAEAFNQLIDNDKAYGFVGDYVVASLGSEEIDDRAWAIGRAESFAMKAPGLWATVRSDKAEEPDGTTVLDERLDPILSFANLATLAQTGPVKQDQRIWWNGFVDVPSKGKYTFYVDCDAKSPSAFYVDGKETAADEPVELSAGWHDVRAKMNLAGDEARLGVSWSGPGIEKQAIPAQRLACADRTRMLIWQLGRPCDLADARNLAGQLKRSIERVDKELAAKLTAIATVDSPDRPAIAAALAELLDYSIAQGQEPPKWETPALKTLLAGSKEIEGPEQRRVVASLVNHFVRRAGSKIEEFNRQAESPEAYGYVRAFIAERLDSDEPEVARWAMKQAAAVQLASSGLWAKTYAKQDPAEGDAPLDERPNESLNFADQAALQLGLAKRIVWKGYLNVPSKGTYKLAIDSAKQAAMQLDGGAVELGKPTELQAGLHPVVVEWKLGDEPPKLVLSWQPPDKQALEVIPGNLLTCPYWPKVLTWEMTEKPKQAEAIAGQLALMSDRIDQPMAEQLLALVGPDNPASLPAAEVLARVLQPGHLDDEFEKKVAEQLCPLVAQAKGPRQRVIVGSLIAALNRLFANKGEDFDKTVKIEGASQTLRGFVLARLDSKEPNVAAWAMENAYSFGLGLTGLWFERCGSADGPSICEQHRDGELNLADPNAVKGTADAKEGEAIRSTGYLLCPSDGAYIFTIDAAKGSPVAMKVAGQAIQSGKPIELSAGMQPLDLRLTIGPDAKLVLNWQQPGTDKPELISRNSYTCPAWPNVLVWQLQQKPDAQRSEEICSHLGRMVPQIDQSLAENLLALVGSDNPAAMPAAEVLARVLHNGHLDDGFDRKIAEQLWPLVAQTKDARQREIVGSLVTALGQLFASKGEDFDKAVKVERASQTLRDFVAARLDAKEPDVAAWAMEHANPVGLGLTGLWFERCDSADGSPIYEQHRDGELNLPDPNAVKGTAGAREGEAIRSTGYLRCPSDGAYVFTIDAAKGSPAEIKMAGKKIESGKLIELAAGVQPLDVRLKIGSDAKLAINWQKPGADKAEAISRDLYTCPAWPKVLVWQLQQKPDAQRSEEICSHLGRMVPQIDQPLAENLLALVGPDSPAAMPVAEVLAKVLHNGHLDDGFDRKMAERLWPLVATTKDARQQEIVGSLVMALQRLFANKGEDFDKAMKAQDASKMLRDFAAERLDAEDLPVRLWAVAHADPFSLLGSGLEGSYFDKDFKTRGFDRVDSKMQFEPGQFGYPDKRNDNMGIRWSGLISVPADGKYIFSSEADDKCQLWIDGQPVIQDSKKPATVTLNAGLREIRIDYVETTGPERLVVYWQVPGQTQRQVLAGELRHVDSVKLLVHKLTSRPEDPKAIAWLQELTYKADRLTTESIEALSKLAEKRAAWQGPLASVAAAAILRNPGKAPIPAAPLLSKSGPAMKGDPRRQAVDALVTYFSTVCGSDKARFQQAVRSDKTYDFLCAEVQSAADSADAEDTQRAQQQAKLLGLKLSTLVRQAKDGRVVLTAKPATVHGKSIKYESGQDKIGSWSSAEDFASWRLAVEKGGTFAVSLSYSCPDDKEGGEFVVAIDGQQLTGKVTTTGDWNKFQTLKLGTMKLDAATHQLTVKPKTIPKGELMNLKSITLELRK